MPYAYIAEEAWRWVANTGINLALLIILAMLVPRAGRFANRVAERRADAQADNDEAKSQLAIAGVGIYIAQAIAFFLILVFFLQEVGFSLAGAAIPATVVSAAIGFGAQNIIADFLAGFFILTEKQYGVGDFVTFEGNGIEVSGNVIQITMRATQIRTMEQSTISIPNSTARICINQSNYWASAVVVIPVPLLGSTSADEAVARSESAARRALNRADIRPKLLDDLTVHPAVDVNPPATVGMPWTLDMRFIVRVEPLAQWMVERAIRLSVLNEFWEEYGSATTIEGTRLDHVVDHTEQFNSVDRYPPTEYMPPVSPLSTQRSDHDDLTPADPDEDPATDVLADDEKAMPRMAFGGALRLSTALLIGAFIVLLIIRGLTIDPDGEGTGSGWLAPPPETPTSEAEEPVETTPAQAPAPAPTQTPTQSPAPAPSTAQPTAPRTPTPSPAETSTQGEPTQPPAPGVTEGASISEAPPAEAGNPLG
ncbi:mechanosensitive ion channel [Corynebacterium sanguinis]|uniref:mechanosensitive ion channel domain-containing protein n=1 Tax=Corynebacterium sanguinis TaxID=2594913 RepID=UPI0011A9B056|nr:mechanosensitive ion channel domain-containing protein [Corynebacterium sanguinis]MCT1555134.1 mechanosensitive ion channel [Corynebacterium sanguinis]MCT2047041.1 mechanosensitive ion channel [Corynebacterium sanguinis]MCT2153879.1 mechanosensitive ion channel [Corynebacterium sanguinis]TVS22136.1 mechanosensitive ion channel [Corynebacterium sanguinis]